MELGQSCPDYYSEAPSLEQCPPKNYHDFSEAVLASSLKEAQVLKEAQILQNVFKAVKEEKEKQKEREKQEQEAKKEQKVKPKEKGSPKEKPKPKKKRRLSECGTYHLGKDAFYLCPLCPQEQDIRTRIGFVDHCRDLHNFKLGPDDFRYVQVVSEEGIQKLESLKSHQKCLFCTEWLRPEELTGHVQCQHPGRYAANPVACNLCAESFSSMHERRLHKCSPKPEDETSMTSKDEFVMCLLCPHFYRSLPFMKTHITTNPGHLKKAAKKVYRCQECLSVTGKGPESLFQHMAEEHNIDREDVSFQGLDYCHFDNDKMKKRNRKRKFTNSNVNDGAKDGSKSQQQQKIISKGAKGPEEVSKCDYTVPEVKDEFFETQENVIEDVEGQEKTDNVMGLDRMADGVSPEMDCISDVKEVLFSGGEADQSEMESEIVETEANSVSSLKVSYLENSGTEGDKCDETVDCAFPSQIGPDPLESLDQAVEDPLYTCPLCCNPDLSSVDEVIRHWKELHRVHLEPSDLTCLGTTLMVKVSNGQELFSCFLCNKFLSKYSLLSHYKTCHPVRYVDDSVYQCPLCRDLDLSNATDVIQHWKECHGVCLKQSDLGDLGSTRRTQSRHGIEMFRCFLCDKYLSKYGLPRHYKTRHPERYAEDLIGDPQGQNSLECSVEKKCIPGLNSSGNTPHSSGKMKKAPNQKQSEKYKICKSVYKEARIFEVPEPNTEVIEEKCHTNDFYFLCPLCPRLKNLNTKANFIEHCLELHGIAMATDDFQHVKFVNKTRAHATSNTAKKIVCFFCASPVWRRNFNQHLQYKHPDHYINKTVSCTSCYMRFGSKNLMRGHTCDKKRRAGWFACTLCPNVCLRRMEIKIHTRDNPRHLELAENLVYKCRRCDVASFLGRKLYVQHMRSEHQVSSWRDMDLYGLDYIIVETQ